MNVKRTRGWLMKVLEGCLTLLAAVLLLFGMTLISAAQRSKPPNKAGIWLLLAVNDQGSQKGQSVETTTAVIIRRCRRLGIHCKLQRHVGEKTNRLMLRFWTRMDSGRIKEVLLAEGLEVRPVTSPPFPAPILEYPTREEAAAAAGDGAEVFPFVNSGVETYLIGESYQILSGSDMRNCAAFRSPEEVGKYEVGCRLKPAGGVRLKSWTGANIHRYIAVIFNRRAMSAAYIKAPIWYDFAISGGFQRQQAEDLAVILDSGNLPAPLELLEEGTYWP